jgi:hypothetical protein
MTAVGPDHPPTVLEIIQTIIPMLLLQGEIVLIVTHEDICWDIFAVVECASVAMLDGWRRHRPRGP